MKTDSHKIHTLRNSGIRTVEYGRIFQHWCSSPYIFNGASPHSCEL